MKYENTGGSSGSTPDEQIAKEKMLKSLAMGIGSPKLKLEIQKVEYKGKNTN